MQKDSGENFAKKEGKIKIPDYTKTEELINMISHIVGAVCGMVFLIILLIVTTKNNNTRGVVSSVVYSLSVMLLYACSAYYHGLKKGAPKKVFRVLDHCSIYLLIAGTYTVIALSGIVPHFKAVGWFMFGSVWALSVLGIVLNAVSIEKFKVISMVLNILIGWFAVFFAGRVIESISVNGFLLVIAGGLCYTIGAVLYGIGKKKRYFHSVFHIFCLAGTIVQFVGIVLYSV